MITGNIKKPSLIREILLGWANLIFAGVLSLLVSLFTSMLMSSNIWKGIIGLFTMAILVCIIGNYAYNCAKNDKAYERTFKASHKNLKHLILSLTISAPLILQWIALLLLKVFGSSNGDNLFVIYKTINPYYLPWINVFCPNPILNELSYMALITMLAFTIIPAITFSIVYVITYNNIDIEKILVYNKD